MNYELTIRCQNCGITRSWGSYTSAPDLSDAEVWEKAVANPDCEVTQENCKVERSEETVEGATVAVYTLSAVPPEPTT